MDARGIYWRRYPTHLSMVPVTNDNEPVPEPYVIYRPVTHGWPPAVEYTQEDWARVLDALESYETALRRIGDDVRARHSLPPYGSVPSKRDVE